MIVDGIFVAESLGLPLIPPYFSVKGGHIPRQGVNYAVAGSTALNASFVEAKGNGSVVINASLKIQLAWFKKSLALFCGKITSLGMIYRVDVTKKLKALLMINGVHLSNYNLSSNVKSDFHM